MSFPLKSLALSGLAMLFLSLPAFSQTSVIEGIVKDPDGKVLQGAVVNIDRTDIKGHYTVKTDKKGHYGHYGLPLGGTFDVSVLVDGQVKDMVKGVHTKGDPTPVNFDLKNAQAAAAGAAPQEADRGMTKAQKEEFEKQAKAREAALAKNKELNDAYTAGRTALDAKMYDAAIESFEKASMLDDKQVAVWSGLADAYVGAAGTKSGADASALYDKGFDAFKKAIELKPDDAAYYNNFALALAKDKKIDEAKTNLDKAAQLDPPGAGKYFYNMGALLVNSAQNEAAGEEFKKAIAADPTYADAQYQYGLFLTSKATTDPSGKIVPAPGTIQALQKYLELKPDGAFAGSAKELIAGLGGSVSTTFNNPNAPAGNKKKK
ncbi:MAG TPA: carboxypeptidase regulatory-like domain-containing protein [Bryobacteraceae bacterium]|jgi:tetratricopeptide (TPR) repeat protein|nr:carboxypeptidase regulatory-like domain-containing protein [Bryobacteraceae bacterium]